MKKLIILLTALMLVSCDRGIEANYHIKVSGYNYRLMDYTIDKGCIVGPDEDGDMVTICNDNYSIRHIIK